MSKCCCCIPFRIGSIIMAVLWISQSIYSLVTSGGQRSNIPKILDLIYSGCLLFGALKYHRKAVLVSLVMGGVFSVIFIMLVIIIFALMESIGSRLANDCEYYRPITGSECEELKSTVATAGNIAFFFLGSCLFHVYFWICIYSFYKELKEKGEWYAV